MFAIVSLRNCLEHLMCKIWNFTSSVVFGLVIRLPWNTNICIGTIIEALLDTKQKGTKDWNLKCKGPSHQLRLQHPTLTSWLGFEKPERWFRASWMWKLLEHKSPIVTSELKCKHGNKYGHIKFLKECNTFHEDTDGISSGKGVYKVFRSVNRYDIWTHSTNLVCTLHVEQITNRPHSNGDQSNRVMTWTLLLIC